MANFRTSKNRGKSNSKSSGRRRGGQQQQSEAIGYMTIFEHVQDFDSGGNAPGGKGYIEFTAGEYEGQVFSIALWAGDKSVASGQLRNQDNELRIVIMLPKKAGKAEFTFMIFEGDGKNSRMICSGALYAHDELEGIFQGKVFLADDEEEDDERSSKRRSSRRKATPEQRSTSKSRRNKAAEEEDDVDEEDDYEEDEEEEDDEEEVPTPPRRTSSQKSRRKPEPEPEEEDDDELDEEDDEEEDEDDEEDTADVVPNPRKKSPAKIPLKLGKKKTRLSTPGR